MKWIFLVFLSLTLQAEEAISWGSSDHGVRAGLSILKVSGESQLRMTFQNVSEGEVDVFLYSKTGIGPVYSTKFSVVSPDHKTYDAFYFGGVEHVAGHLEPVLTRLSSQDTYNLLFSFSKMFAVIDGKYIPLHEVLKNGFTIHSSQEVSQKLVSWFMRNSSWRGRMTVWSGKVSASYSQIETYKR